jgi:hypothetical protein
VKTYGAPPLGSAPQRSTFCATTELQPKDISHKKAQKAPHDLINAFVLFVPFCGKGAFSKLDEILAVEGLEIQFFCGSYIGLQNYFHLL